MVPVAHLRCDPVGQCDGARPFGAVSLRGRAAVRLPLHDGRVRGVLRRSPAMSGRYGVLRRGVPFPQAARRMAQHDSRGCVRRGRRGGVHRRAVAPRGRLRRDGPSVLAGGRVRRAGDTHPRHDPLGVRRLRGDSPLFRGVPLSSPPRIRHPRGGDCAFGVGIHSAGPAADALHAGWIRELARVHRRPAESQRNRRDAGLRGVQEGARRGRRGGDRRRDARRADDGHIRHACRVEPPHARDVEGRGDSELVREAQPRRHAGERSAFRDMRVVRDPVLRAHGHRMAGGRLEPRRGRCLRLHVRRGVCTVEEGDGAHGFRRHGVWHRGRRDGGDVLPPHPRAELHIRRLARG